MINLIYLRKSRSDDPALSIEEVLQKHETILQEYAERELGHRIPEGCIYREVVSGESIEDRVEMQKVLSRIEDPMVGGVIVVEPQRLSRGDLEDCGRLITTFRLTHTKVITPVMTYDLENKMERKFFQDELLRGRDYLEYTKEILMRGRIAAVKRGCYIGCEVPYGYKKVTVGKDHTLEIVEDEAAVVRHIFNRRVAGLTPGQIAAELDGMGVPAPRGGASWNKSSVRHMLENEHYAGRVVFNKIRGTRVLEGGEVQMHKYKQSRDDRVIAEGKHPAIIDKATWEAVQTAITNSPRHNAERELHNVFSGVLFCAKCGKAMRYRVCTRAEDRLSCGTVPVCFRSARYSLVENAIINALEQVELPNLRLRAENGDGDALAIQQRLVRKLEAQMDDYRAQEERQYDLLETGKYSQDLFDRRNAGLRAKMDECAAALEKARRSIPKSIDYKERVSTLEEAIAALRDPSVSVEQKNRLVRAIVERIEYSSVPSCDGADVKDGAKRGGTRGRPAYDFPITLDVRLRI